MTLLHQIAETTPLPTIAARRRVELPLPEVARLAIERNEIGWGYSPPAAASSAAFERAGLYLDADLGLTYAEA